MLVDRSGPITFKNQACWTWVGPFWTKSGYGIYKSDTAYRQIWRIVNGEPSKGYDLHHLCRNKACCNPNHLKELTRKEHSMLHGPFQEDMRQKRLAELREAIQSEEMACA